MKILVVIHDFKLGGAERIAIRLASFWAREGKKVLLASGRPNGPLRKLLDPKVRLISSSNSIERSFSRLELARFVSKIVQRTRPDVIFLPGNYYFEIAGFLRLTVPDCPPIAGKLSNVVRRPSERRLKAFARTTILALKARYLDRLVLTSSAFAPEVRTKLGAPQAQLAVVPNPVLDAVPLPVVAGHRPVTLIAAGRLEPQKNFALLLRTLALLPADIDLTILGDGPLLKDLQALATDLGVLNRVVFAGYVPDTTEWFRQARLFVLSSDYEGFCTVVVEALAVGLPVVATDCSPSISEFLDTPAKGRVVPTGRPDLLAAAILEQLQSPLSNPEAMQATAGRFLLSSAGSEYLRLFEEMRAA